MNDEPEWMAEERTASAHSLLDHPELAALELAVDRPSSNGQRTPAERLAEDVETLRHRVLDVAQLRAMRPPMPLVSGLLDLDSLAVLYGPPGAGKSVTALDLALRVATGTRWHGHQQVQHGAVLYIAAEGAHGLAGRVDAWKETTATILDPDRLHVLPYAVNLFDARPVDALVDYLEDLAPTLIIVDTLARCMVGADENSSRDMSTAVAALDRLRIATSACVLAVHHSGKNTDAGARGHTALLGAADTMLKLGITDRIVTIEQEKQKHHEPGHRQTYRLASAAGSVALIPYTGTSAEDLTGKTLDALRVLAEIEQPEGIAFTRWRTAAAATISEATLARALKVLTDRALIAHADGSSKRSPRYVLTDTGRSHLAEPAESDGEQA